jgi:hypothetical protein
MTRDDIISLSTLDLSDPLDAKIQQLVLTVYDRGKADGEREALQWAAKLCDEYARMCRDMGRDHEIADNLALHIRALKTP